MTFRIGHSREGNIIKRAEWMKNYGRTHKNTYTDMFLHKTHVKYLMTQIYETKIN
jgi:hypothetical protein